METNEPLVGFAWGRYPADVDPDRPLGFSFLVDRHNLPDSMMSWAEELHLPRLYERQEMVAWRFGDPMDDVYAVFEEAGEKANPLSVMKTVWLLMQQKISLAEDVDLDRPARRRLQRQDMPISGVKVVALRRQSRKHPEGAPSGREYQHQWIVDSHWRQQWYPSRGVHRPVLIMPYVKGPEGAPLVIKDKVNVWKR